MTHNLLYSIYPLPNIKATQLPKNHQLVIFKLSIHAVTIPALPITRNKVV